MGECFRRTFFLDCNGVSTISFLGAKITDATMVRDHTGWVKQSKVSLIIRELVRWDQAQEMWGDQFHSTPIRTPGSHWSTRPGSISILQTGRGVSSDPTGPEEA